MTRTIAAIALALSLVMPGAVQAATIVIDSFDLEQATFLDRGENFGGSIEVDPAGAGSTTLLGGERGMVTTRFIEPGVSPTNEPILAEISGGDLFFSLNGGAGSTQLAYGGGRTLLPDVDLTDGGTNNSFVLDFLEPDRGISMGIGIRAAGQTAIVTQNTQAFQNTMVFDFGDFTRQGVDLTQVDAVSLFINAESLDPNASVFLDSFVATQVPEPPVPAVPLPAGALLLLSGAVAFGVMRRRARVG